MYALVKCSTACPRPLAAFAAEWEALLAAASSSDAIIALLLLHLRERHQSRTLPLDKFVVVAACTRKRDARPDIWTPDVASAFRDLLLSL